MPRSRAGFSSTKSDQAQPHPRILSRQDDRVLRQGRQLPIERKLVQPGQHETRIEPEGRRHGDQHDRSHRGQMAAKPAECTTGDRATDE